jgi:hypothetical protein
MRTNGNERAQRPLGSATGPWTGGVGDPLSLSLLASGIFARRGLRVGAALRLAAMMHGDFGTMTRLRTGCRIAAIAPMGAASAF